MMNAARKEWDAVDEEFVLYGIMDYLKIPFKFEKTKFDKLPICYQKRLATWAKWCLDYSEDWKEEQELLAQ